MAIRNPMGRRRGRPSKAESARIKRDRNDHLKAKQLAKQLARQDEQRKRQVKQIRKMLAAKKRKREDLKRAEAAKIKAKITPVALKTGLKRSDPDFFKKIGQIGGKHTKRRRLKDDPDYYAKIAIIAHQVARENRAAAEEAAEVEAAALIRAAKARGRK